MLNNKPQQQGNRLLEWFKLMIGNIERLDKEDDLDNYWDICEILEQYFEQKPKRVSRKFVDKWSNRLRYHKPRYSDKHREDFILLLLKDLNITVEGK